MYLLSFDIISSKESYETLATVIKKNDYFTILKSTFNIQEKDIQINNGDQIRILLHSPTTILNIIFNVFSFLTEHNFKARLFISNGSIKNLDYDNLSEADGDIFYENKRIEEETKKEKQLYKSKKCLIRYTDKSNTHLLDTLFLSLSSLSLSKEKNISTLNMYLFNDLNQKEIATKLGVSPKAISKRLQVSELYLLERIITEIDTLFKKENL